MCRMSWNLGTPIGWNPQGLFQVCTGIALRLEQSIGHWLECLRKLYDQKLQGFYFAPHTVRKTKGLEMGEEEKWVQCCAENGYENFVKRAGSTRPWTALLSSGMIFGWENKSALAFLSVQKGRTMHKFALWLAHFPTFYVSVKIGRCNRIRKKLLCACWGGRG